MAHATREEVTVEEGEFSFDGAVLRYNGYPRVPRDVLHGHIATADQQSECRLPFSDLARGKGSQRLWGRLEAQLRLYGLQDTSPSLAELLPQQPVGVKLSKKDRKQRSRDQWRQKFLKLREILLEAYAQPGGLAVGEEVQAIEKRLRDRWPTAKAAHDQAVREMRRRLKDWPQKSPRLDGPRLELRSSLPRRRLRVRRLQRSRWKSGLTLHRPGSGRSVK